MHKTNQLEQKVSDIMGRMTLDEKIGQLNQLNGFWEVTGPVAADHFDEEKFDQCLLWDRHALRVEHNRTVASAHGVVSTPIFFVIAPDGTMKRIAGPQPPMVFESVISELS